MRLLVIVGNPKPGSLCLALGEAYAEGARESGFEAELIDVGALDFDPILRSGYGHQPLEPDLLAAQSAINAADHVVWIWPLWFGLPPALMKGFVERVMVKDFAIEVGEPYPGGAPNYTPLLKGKSARIVITMAMPTLVYRFIASALAARAFEHNVLRFVGFSPVKRTLFGMAEAESDATRKGWLEKMRALGRRGA